jgi:hypothetical protein
MASDEYVISMSNFLLLNDEHITIFSEASPTPALALKISSKVDSFLYNRSSLEKMIYMALQPRCGLSINVLLNKILLHSAWIDKDPKRLSLHKKLYFSMDTAADLVLITHPTVQMRK